MIICTVEDATEHKASRGRLGPRERHVVRRLGPELGGGRGDAHRLLLVGGHGDRAIGVERETMYWEGEWVYRAGAETTLDRGAARGEADGCSRRRESEREREREKKRGG